MPVKMFTQSRNARRMSPYMLQKQRIIPNSKYFRGYCNDCGVQIRVKHIEHWNRCRDCESEGESQQRQINSYHCRRPEQRLKLERMEEQ